MNLHGIVRLSRRALTDADRIAAARPYVGHLVTVQRSGGDGVMVGRVLAVGHLLGAGLVPKRTPAITLERDGDSWTVPLSLVRAMSL